ncbi:MAG: 30S ribosomal protein S1 [Desulfurivibrionaceae bacterium]|jgi:small subunit ribosomal protein S1|nr:30S ribosomal protein S1 [Pseudomonadota bacterium]MCG2823393.1 30S ribosomal protein S1 [Desulfobulbaceae bacterium]MDP2002515.1 30S ribosomal protein S1 [Desulfurivibrionaceae bacterium]PKN22890.1 MAG: 30S ribosomal protein S1 [Deltaproteobacteria bacterium HGW-Deltaproteobacteria-3]MBU4412450.1 30S ribosomal protein S1 [Pseudomonadota bacterium]
MTDDDKSFAEMFQETAASAKERLRPGQKIEATVVRIAREWIFLDLGAKSEGAVAKNEFIDGEGNLTVAEGDRVQVYFLSEKNNERLFTAKVSGGAVAGHLDEACQNGIPVEGTVTGETKGGFEVRFSGSVRAFCPFSQMEMRRIENAEAYIGKKFAFRITKFSEHGKNIVVSRRALLEEERAQQKETLQESLAIGQTVKGVITSIRDFGAFVDIGGIEGLIPVSEIAWGRIEDIHERLAVGQEVTVTVLKMDWDQDRYSFSLKDSLPNPWEEIGGMFPEGSVVTGKVVRLTEFGAFVSLAPGIDGLVHISKLGAGRRISHPREVVQVGDALEVKIDSVDSEKKRLSLSLPLPAKVEGGEAAKAGGKKDKGAGEGENRDDFRQYIAEKKKDVKPMGTFADLFGKGKGPGK